jgi:hypothetical protein
VKAPRRGQTGKSHDGFPLGHGGSLELTSTGPTTARRARDAILAAVLGRPGGKGIVGLPQRIGPTAERLVARFAALLRPDRVIVTGAVAAADGTNPAILEDLSDGTALAGAGSRIAAECDPLLVKGKPTADIIWIIDGSSSMGDNNKVVIKHAKRLFDRATKGGLDFRMGVVPMVQPKRHPGAVGQLCTAGTKPADRFLLPGERQLFESCVVAPLLPTGELEYGMVSAREAVLRHLPRAAGSPHRIRSGASLVLIVITDERSATLSDLMNQNPYLAPYVYCNIPPAFVKQLTGQYFRTEVELFTGKSHGGGGRAVMHLIGPLCQSACADDIAHGYIEVSKVTGGLVADICEEDDLGDTLDEIFDDLIVRQPPAVLERRPISASLAVALGGKQLQRSAVKGFQYHRRSNSILFRGVGNKKGDQAMVSYYRWVERSTTVE